MDIGKQPEVTSQRNPIKHRDFTIYSTVTNSCQIVLCLIENVVETRNLQSDKNRQTESDKSRAQFENTASVVTLKIYGTSVRL